MNDLPIHFFTMVLDGMPFITHHLPEFRKLPFRWHWHVAEGPSASVKCGEWAAKNGGHLPYRYLETGGSQDGTLQYLYGQNPKEISIDKVCCRRPLVWNGKIEMIQRIMKRIDEPCLLWEIDADEIWTAEQIITARDMFLSDPTRTAAIYRCYYFVGPNLVITSLETYGNHNGEWRRTWRYEPGDVWKSHEPPVLIRDGKDVAEINPFRYQHTMPNGLIFQHFAYATEAQAAFKEEYYGYKGAVKAWKRLQDYQSFPCALKDFFPWVTDGAIVNRASAVGIKPLVKC